MNLLIYFEEEHDEIYMHLFGAPWRKNYVFAFHEEAVHKFTFIRVLPTDFISLPEKHPRTAVWAPVKSLNKYMSVTTSKLPAHAPLEAGTGYLNTCK